MDGTLRASRERRGFDLDHMLKAALYAPASPENEARWAKFMGEFARLTGGEE